MFPEGTRHGGQELLNFKKGAFHVAISSQCPIQPVVVSQYYFLDHGKRIFDPGKSFIIVVSCSYSPLYNYYFVCLCMIVCPYCIGHIVITILPAIPTEGMTKNDLSRLIEKSRSAMQDMYTKSSDEIKTKYFNVS